MILNLLKYYNKLKIDSKFELILRIINSEDIEDPKLEDDDIRNKYQDDDENPEVEIWKWILVVPWWCVFFEYNWYMIDLERKLKEEAEKVERGIDENLMIKNVVEVQNTQEVKMIDKVQMELLRNKENVYEEKSDIENQKSDVPNKEKIVLCKVEERNINIKEIVVQKENDPIEEPIIRKDEKGTYTILNKLLNPAIVEQLERDEQKRKMLVKIPDPILKIPEEV
jgi:hypothetical protein